jgi:hypothetical protein
MFARSGRSAALLRPLKTETIWYGASGASVGEARCPFGGGRQFFITTPLGTCTASP